jgi:NADH dehydrogenase
MRSRRIIVVGTGYAGLLAAFRARRVLRADVTLVSDSPLVVDRIRLHEHLAHGTDVVTPVSQWLRGSGVLHVLGRAEAVDGSSLVLADGTTLAFDHLLLALGSEGLPAPAGARPVSLASRPDVARTLAAGGRIAVVGAGATGIELAAELAGHAGARVTLVGSALAGELSPRARSHVERYFTRAGAELRLGVRARAVEPNHLETDRGQVPFDLCLWTAGFRATKPLAGLDVELDPMGRVFVGPDLRLPGRPDVQVIGDAGVPMGVASPPRPGCKSAMPLAAHAIDVLSGSARPFRWLDSGTCLSLGRRDGVIQTLRSDGRSGAALTGRPAAWVKERVARFVQWSLAAERDHRFAYRWMRGRDGQRALDVATAGVR